MDPLQSLGIAFLAWRSTLRVALDPRPWLPIVLFAAARGVLLLGLAHFHAPSIIGVTEPVVRGLAGESATHFPAHLHALPMLLARAEVPLRVLLAPLCFGAAIAQFAGAFRRVRVRSSSALGGSAWFGLIAVGVIVEGLVLGYGACRAFAVDSILPEGSRLLVLLPLADLGFLVMVTVLQIEAMLAIVLRRARLVGAVKFAATVRASATPTTLLLVLVPVAARFVWNQQFGLDGQGHLRLEDPEGVVGLLAMGIVLELLGSFLLIGSVVRAMLWERGASR